MTASPNAVAGRFAAAFALLLAIYAAGYTSLEGHQLRTLQRLVAVTAVGLMAVAGFGGAIGRWALERFQRFDAWARGRPSRVPVLLAILVLAYTAFWCAVTFLRHYYFHSSYDLAIMDQVVWNSSEGRLFARSIESTSDLGDHVRPYLTLLGVLYLVVASPYVLLTVQSLVLGLSAVPLYRLARRKIDSPAVALLAAFCLLAFPPLGFVNRFDFHVEMLSVPLLILAYDRLDARNLRRASLFMALALLCKENLGLTVAALGIAAGLIYGRWRFGLVWAVIGVAYSTVALFVVIPAFRGAPSDTLARYEWLSDTPSGMLAAALSEPMLVAERIFTVDHLLSLLQAFAPLAFVPLLGWPALLPTVPAYLYNFLASHSAQGAIYVHYMAPVIPFIFVAAVFGLRRLGERAPSMAHADAREPIRPDRTVALAALLMTAAVAGSWIYENPVTGNSTVVMAASAQLVPMGSTAPIPIVWPNDAAIREGLRQVPGRIGLLTTTYYAPHLSQRTWIEMIPRAPVSGLNAEAEAIFLNVRDPRGWSCHDYFEVVSAAAASDFGLEFERDGVLLLRRSQGDRPRLREVVRSWQGCE